MILKVSQSLALYWGSGEQWRQSELKSSTMKSCFRETPWLPRAGKGGPLLPTLCAPVCAGTWGGCCEYVAKWDQFLEPPKKPTGLSISWTRSLCSGDPRRPVVEWWLKPRSVWTPRLRVLLPSVPCLATWWSHGKMSCWDGCVSHRWGESQEGLRFPAWGDRENRGDSGRCRHREVMRRCCTWWENEPFFGHPEFALTVPFMQKFHLTSDSAIPFPFSLPHFHPICHLPSF